MITSSMAFGDFGADAMRKWLMEQVRADVAAIKDAGFKFLAAQMALDCERRLISLDKVYTGRLAQAFGTVRDPDGLLFVNVMPYAGEIEHGRPPGPVNAADILEWTRVKLFGLPPRVKVGPIPFGAATPVKAKIRTIRSKAQRKAMRARREAGSLSRDEMEAEAFAAAKRITAKLTEKGTEPTLYFRDAHIGAGKHIGKWVRKNLPVASAASSFVGKVRVPQPKMPEPTTDLSDIPF